jgi:hypothetical protein
VLAQQHTCGSLTVAGERTVSNSSTAVRQMHRPRAMLRQLQFQWQASVLSKS